MICISTQQVISRLFQCRVTEHATVLIDVMTLTGRNLRHTLPK